ncbi:MAG: hypothetical protein ACRYFX_16420 [Janthinobacterium lividum]
MDAIALGTSLATGSMLVATAGVLRRWVDGCSGGFRRQALVSAIAGLGLILLVVSMLLLSLVILWLIVCLAAGIRWVDLSDGLWL